MMDSISSLMEEVTWRSLAVFLESAAGVAGVAGAEASPKAAEHKAAAICHLIVPNSSMHEARHGSSLRIYSKGFAAFDVKKIMGLERPCRPLLSRVLLSSNSFRQAWARSVHARQKKGGPKPALLGVAYGVLLFGARNECSCKIVAQIDNRSAVLGFADSGPGGDQRFRKALAERGDLRAAQAEAHHLGFHRSGAPFGKGLVVTL